MTTRTNKERCWPGYEPVPGKKPNEQGSCRKKPSSKTTASEKQFRSRRQQQLDAWSAKHPNSPRKAAQHLHAPVEPRSKRAVSPKRRTKKLAA